MTISFVKCFGRNLVEGCFIVGDQKNLSILKFYCNLEKKYILKVKSN